MAPRAFLHGGSRSPLRMPLDNFHYHYNPDMEGLVKKKIGGLDYPQIHMERGYFFMRTPGI